MNKSKLRKFQKTINGQRFFGLKDENGNVVLEPKFDKIKEWSNRGSFVSVEKNSRQMMYRVLKGCPFGREITTEIFGNRNSSAGVALWFYSNSREDAMAYRNGRNVVLFIGEKLTPIIHDGQISSLRFFEGGYFSMKSADGKKTFFYRRDGEILFFGKSSIVHAFEHIRDNFYSNYDLNSKKGTLFRTKRGKVEEIQEVFELTQFYGDILRDYSTKLILYKDWKNGFFRATKLDKGIPSLKENLLDGFEFTSLKRRGDYFLFFKEVGSKVEFHLFKWEGRNLKKLPLEERMEVEGEILFEAVNYPATRFDVSALIKKGGKREFLFSFNAEGKVIKNEELEGSEKLRLSSIQDFQVRILEDRKTLAFIDSEGDIVLKSSFGENRSYKDFCTEPPALSWNTAVETDNFFVLNIGQTTFSFAKTGDPLMKNCIPSLEIENSRLFSAKIKVARNYVSLSIGRESYLLNLVTGKKTKKPTILYQNSDIYLHEELSLMSIHCYKGPIFYRIEV